MSIPYIIDNVQPMVRSLGFLLIVLGLAIAVEWVLYAVVKRVTARTKNSFDNVIVQTARRPIRLLVVVFFVDFCMPLVGLATGMEAVVRQVVTYCIIIGIAWLSIKGVSVLEQLVLMHYSLDSKDNLRARKIYTQLTVFRKIAIFVILLVAFSVFLMTFEEVRQLGMSILASAGIAGLVVGFAAQKTIANLLAGLQIAITRPINIDDVVIVEGEWGRIEEITLTYVVVKIWDLRRLVLPITYFIETPFQNWTRTSSSILGTVYLYADYSLDVDIVRDELNRITAASEWWDGVVSEAVVTDATEKTMEIRALVSAADSPSAWKLRCEVREKLIAYIRKNHPDTLPTVRARLDKTGDSGGDVT